MSESKPIKQSLVFTITHDGWEDDQVKQTINLTFKPGLSGEIPFKKLSKEKKQLQHTVSHLAGVIMDAIGNYK